MQASALRGSFIFLFFISIGWPPQGVGGVGFLEEVGLRAVVSFKGFLSCMYGFAKIADCAEVVAWTQGYGVVIVLPLTEANTFPAMMQCRW